MKGDRLLEALEEAVGARVISEVPRAAGQYSFAHALIRETLYEELSTARRVRLHRQIGDVLEALDAGGATCRSSPTTSPKLPRAATSERRSTTPHAPAERATALMAHEDAAEQFERALQVLEMEEQPDEGQRCELLLALGDALAKAGDTAKAQEIFLQAAEIARPEARRGRFRPGHPRLWGSVPDRWERSDDCMGMLDEALANLPEGDSALRASSWPGAPGSCTSPKTGDQNPAISREAVEMARRVGDLAALAVRAVGPLRVALGAR